MANLRITRIRVSANNAIRVEFNAPLDPLINTGNIDLEPILSMLPKPQVLKVVVRNDLLYITTNYLTPFANYEITFKSTDVQRFKSKNGDQFLLEDGKNNVQFIQGIGAPNNTIKNALIDYQKDGIYNIDGTNLVSKIIDSQAENIARGLYDIGQAANDNYLEHIVEDERHIRGSGPWDRLNQEGAFEVLRVGLTQTDFQKSLSFIFDSFPRNRITLQKTNVSQERLVAGIGLGTFDGLFLTVNNKPVTKLNSVTILYQNGETAEYNISELGYQILNSVYDTDYASTLFSLENNQFKLSENIFNSDLGPPLAGDIIVVDYEYKALGRNIDEESVVVSEVIDATREIVPPIITEFSLEHAPIVSEFDNIAESGGVEFLNPRACIPFSEVHPAFTKEIPYKLEGLPVAPGEYSINYETGRVFVYGEINNDGTGSFPPVATYKYRKSFRENLDYTYNPELMEVVANPLRNDLIGKTVKISFDYEQVLVPGIDYIGDVHVEELDERVENRLSSLISLQTKHTPITNVFRVFNETTGELYPVNRFSDTTIYFSSNNYPKIIDVKRERVSFSDVVNETLILDQIFINTFGVKVFKINLLNNRIIGATEDLIGSSFNTSVGFSRVDLFDTELYFDGQTSTVSQNINKLGINDYTIDYVNGVIYVGVVNTQNLDLGTVNYKKAAIKTNNRHIITVSELYYSLDSSSGIKTRLNYDSFNDTEIIPNVFNQSDERFLNGDVTLPYQYINGIITLSDDSKNVRGIFDLYNLNNSRDPINFANGSIINGNVITVNPSGQNIQNEVVISVGGQINLPFLSDGIEIIAVNSVLRSDGTELWDDNGTITDYALNLSGVGSPNVGDVVIVNYQIQLTGGSTPVVDYNRGDYYVDYSYLADEILVSYEWGDNVIDFRQSTAIDEGTEYFVTYRVGALRNALLQNFGTLVDLPIMQSFDTSLPRESYRDALQGALQSFPQGPTLPSMKNLIKSITKIEPEIIESIFDIWSLGISSLYQNDINYTGDPQIVVSKFDHGLFLDSPGQTVTFPASSNIRLEEGTMEMFIIPSWDGLDNDATLRFDKLMIDGYEASANEIYIGADSHHPIINDDGCFTINKFDEKDPKGLPSAIFLENKGYFIYYNEDTKRWNFLAKDGYGNHEYSGRVFTSGEFYDVKYIPNLGEVGDSIRSLTNEIKFKWNLNNDLSFDGYQDDDGYVDGYTFDGITFMSDDAHYLFDMADPRPIPVGLIGTIQDRRPHPAEIEARRRKATNRMSLYKDGRGYLNFEVYDRNSSLAKVSTDISNWKAGQEHFISMAWKIDTFDRRDELHLFVDGQEVPNILRYGGRPVAAAGDRFRTVKPEVVAGIVAKKIIKGNNLVTIAGENVVYSPDVNFATEGIIAGDKIDILEIGFGTFTILSVSNNSLLLDSPAFASFNDARYSVNKFEAIVSDEIDLSSNVAVYKVSGTIEEELPGVRSDFPAYRIDKNSQLQTVLTVFGSADVGDEFIIRTLGLNHRRCRNSVFLWGNTQSVLKTRMPTPINLDEVKVFANILPLMSIGPDNSSIISGNFVASGIVPTVVSNAIEGRNLSIRITGGNVDFSTPVEIEITGTSTGGVSETVVFSSPGTKQTINNWKTITDITVTVKPFTTSSRSMAFEIKETHSITNPDGNNDFPIIRFSYQDNSGYQNLSGDANYISGGYFIDKDIGKKIVIDSPISVAGTYTIVDVLEDGRASISPNPGVFENGTYRIFNTTIGRSGFQNGFFTFEQAGAVGTPYPLPQGRYDFDYSAWLEIPFVNIEDHKGYIGSDFLGMNQAKAVIDEFRILSRKITDVRIGETLALGDKSVTTDALTLRAFKPDSDTLMLIHFDSIPFQNDANFWKISNKEFLQSASSVNGEFTQSLVITDKPYIVDNEGLLSTKSEGSIEFWVSPRFDTFNDPVERYYFDATSLITEETVSLTNTVIKLSGRTKEVLSVRLQTDTNDVGTDYFDGGSIDKDFQTLNLKLPLPSAKTPIKVSYVPNGFRGDRISIFKDRYGFLTFRVNANGNEFEVRQPIFWQRDTWHRIFVSFKFNRRDNRDELRMFVDGRESGTIRFGQGLLFGQGFVFGQGMEGEEDSRLQANIDFRDIINRMFIGSTFTKTNIAAARFDNVKISNIARSPLICSGIPIDENFQTNIDIVKPVVQDLYTLYLINFDQLLGKNEYFATLRDEKFGIFNFIINVIDSFRIVSDSDKINQIMEELIYALKPAQSKVTINVIL